MRTAALALCWPNQSRCPIAAINTSGGPGNSGTMLPINPANITNSVIVKPMICSAVIDLKIAEIRPYAKKRMNGFLDLWIDDKSAELCLPIVQLCLLRFLLRFQMKLMQEAMIKRSKHDGDAGKKSYSAKERVTTCKNLASGRLQFAERSHA